MSRVAGYELEGDSTVLMEGRMIREMGSESLEMEIAMELSGTTTLAMKTEAQ